MSTQSLFIPTVERSIDNIDARVACVSKEYMNRHRYKVGNETDIKSQLKLIRIREILENRCNQVCMDVRCVIEKISKLL